MKKITKISVFDFDGTLIDTPLPEAGKPIWKEKKGVEWPHRGWWGRHESLDMSIFEFPVVSSVIDAYEKEYAADHTVTALLTGRLVKLTEHVMAILKAKKLLFDEYHLNRGGATEHEKIRAMEKLLVKYKDVTEMELWDDRLAHVPIFEAWGQKQIESGRLSKFKLNVVPSPDGGRH